MKEQVITLQAQLERSEATAKKHEVSMLLAAPEASYVPVGMCAKA